MVKFLALLAASYEAAKALRPYAWVLLVLSVMLCQVAAVYAPAAHERAFFLACTSVGCMALGGMAEKRFG